MQVASAMSGAALAQEGCSLAPEACPGNGQSSASGDMSLPSLVAEAVHIENRLRKHCLELLEPTIKRQSTMSTTIRENKVALDAMKAELQEVKLDSGRSSSVLAAIKSLRAELADLDKERRTHEQFIGGRVSEQELEATSLRKDMEGERVEYQSMAKALKSLGSQLVTTRDEAAEIRKYCMERCDQTRDTIAKLRHEFETRMAALDIDVLKMQDVDTVMQMTLSQATHDMQLFGNTVTESADSVDKLWEVKASVSMVEELQSRFSQSLQEFGAQVTDLKAHFGTAVNDVKAHVDAAANVLGATSGKQMEWMRTESLEQTSKAVTRRSPQSPETIFRPTHPCLCWLDNQTWCHYFPCVA